MPRHTSLDFARVGPLISLISPAGIISIICYILAWAVNNTIMILDNSISNNSKMS